MDWEELRRTSEEKHESYLAFAAKVAADLKHRCQAAGLLVRVQHRAKTPRSISQKLIAAPHLTYDLLQDKAGVRVIPERSSDISGVVEVVEEHFDVKSSRDQSELLKADAFGYGGWHMVVEAQTKSACSGGEGLRCEVQIRTEAQHLWAVTSHEISYKASETTRDALKRPLARVAALLETVDMEIERIRDQKGSATERLADILRAAHWQLGGSESHQGMTVAVVDRLLPIFEVLGSTAEDLNDFISSNEAALRKKVGDYPSDTLELLLTQPESLLVFFLVEENVEVLREQWPADMSRRWLEAIEAAWPAP